jgi:hypothetical protein
MFERHFAIQSRQASNHLARATSFERPTALTTPFACNDSISIFDRATMLEVIILENLLISQVCFAI